MQYTNPIYLNILKIPTEDAKTCFFKKKERNIMSDPSATRPLDLLNRSLEARVLVKLKGGRELRGKLKGFDLHMNLILDEAEEVIDKNNNKMVGTVIVRGDNVILLSPAIKTESE